MPRGDVCPSVRASVTGHRPGTERCGIGGAESDARIVDIVGPTKGAKINTTASIKKTKNIRDTCGIHNGFDDDHHENQLFAGSSTPIVQTRRPSTVTARSMYQHHSREYYENEEHAPYFRYI